MSAPLKKPRHARIEHSNNHSGASSLVKTGASDENAHLWVVSYADLLMVLLCFFVLFYSTDKKHVDSVIQRIVLTTSQHTQAHAVSASGSTDRSTTASGAAGATASAGSGLGNDLRLALSQVNAKVIAREDSLLIELPDDAYGKGKTLLLDENQLLLIEILTKLKLYQDQVDLIFIGHTDTSPLVQSKTRRVSDNLDLSLERAKNAMNMAAAMGFSKNNLRVEGDATTRRESRTLSLSIVERRIKK